MRTRLLLSLLFFMTSLWIHADEFVIVGQVYDISNNTPLQGVNVYFLESGKGAQSDNTGFFFLKGDGNEKTIIASCVGYKSRTIRIKPGKTKSILIRMHENITELEDLFVLPGVNVAEKMIGKVAENRWKNDIFMHGDIPLKVSEENVLFLYHPLQQGKTNFLIGQFEKTGLDTVEQEIVNPLFMSKLKYIQKNDKEKEYISRETKASPRNLEMMLENFTGQMPSRVNFYETFPMLFGKKFLSPFSSSSHLFYRYVLKDSLIRNGRKTYHIRFKSINPRNLTFDGSCYIDSADYAIQELDMQLSPNANINFVKEIRLSSSYVLKENWIPQTEFLQIRLKNSLLPDSLRTDPTLLMLKKLSYVPENMEALKSTGFANSNYTEIDLNAKLDEMNNLPVMKAATWMADAILTGYMDFGKVDLGKIYQLGRYSDQEGLKLNIPLRTNEKLWKNLSAGGYAGYGFGNKEFSYRGELNWRLPLRRKAVLGINMTDDYRRINYDVNNEGLRENPHVSGSSDFLNTIVAFKKASSLYHYKELEAFGSWDWTSDLESKLTLRSTRMYANDVLNMYNSTESFPVLGRQSVTFTTRMSFDEKVYEDHLNRIYVRNYSPVLYLTLEGGRYQFGEHSGIYSKVLASIRQKLLFGWGQWDYLIEGGYTLGEVPWPLMHMPAYNEYEMFGKYRFTLMNPMEYMASRYLNMHHELMLNGILLNYIPGLNVLKLRELFLLKAYYGAIDQQSGDLMDLPASVTRSPWPYVEVGTGVTNIFKILTVQWFWRLTDPHKEGVKDHRFSVVLRLNF